ncbi:uncharacterized protein TRIADDRAFT_19365 [Trichoplax adhaerens]|uniref:Uncharacterized protein n=1 Tax=Trichoplax adhaerens TaxID=10228 RepID=B3RLG8_TRIAD|nr:hypothetical protein TRIADDRAFT_19365 [Trichoplax adhaerens]EDV28770.1 hypothetical protein TRIADDRAFT_19365 [Trichoplax adhaerens]|eukprot:XP_002107972.1 hypothetical protein TRIADDRAFT_19365 [Trichoplax adhaerens]
MSINVNKCAISSEIIDTAFKQQRMRAWKPIMTTGSVVPAFLIVGVIFLPLGILFLFTSNNVNEVVVDYTHCNASSVSNSLYLTSPGMSCADYIQTTNFTENCYCNISFQLSSAMTGKVYMYYGLENFYQNHRRYVRARSDYQLLGNPTYTVSDCEPFRYANGTTTPIAPCGAIANSLFNDSLTLTFQNTTGNVNVGLIDRGIAWSVDLSIKYNNPTVQTGFPLRYGFNGTAKPPYWRKPVYELSSDPNNNGFKNEDLIVWMRTAALPRFRKLYRKVNHTQAGFVNGLPSGNYFFNVEYNFPVTTFSGKKRLILSTASWLGGKNPFLGIAYITVGSMCIVLGFLCLFYHYQYANR